MVHGSGFPRSLGCVFTLFIHGMNIDAAWFSDFEKLVAGMMTLRRSRDYTIGAQVKIWVT